MVTSPTKQQSYESSMVIQINPGEQTTEPPSKRVSIKNGPVEGQVNLKLTESNMSYRLGRRKILHKRLMVVNDFACLLGLLGIILMIIVNEINFTKVHDADNVASWVLKLCISGSTLVLLILIFLYHKFALQLHCNQNGLADWRIGLTRWKIFNIIIELVVCVIHPLPREIKDDETSAPSSPYPLSYTSIDVGLGIPMFLRLYLICRTLLLHSHLMRDTAAQSLGSFNRVPMNFLFLMKTYLEQWPARCLIIFCGMAFFIGSWCLRACNYTSDLEHFTIGNSMWLFLVTYTTVGYGDLYPSSTSGRVIAALIGLVGLMSSALLIAVITQKLAFRREEKYVHTFVLNIELVKTRRVQAANIIKFAFRVWLLKRANKMNSFKCLTAQRKLLFYIGAIQSTKKSQCDLIDNCVGLHELMTVQRSTNEMANTVLSKILDLRHEIKTMEQKMLNFNVVLENLQKSVDALSGQSTSKL